MIIDQYLSQLDSILEDFDQSYFDELEQTHSFPTEVIQALQKYELMTIFLHQVYGGKGLSLQDYAHFQLRLLSRDVSLAFIYNQHVAFLKYLEGMPRTEFLECLGASLIENQSLCALALSEEGGLDFQSQTEKQAGSIRKQAVTSAGQAAYYLVNYLEEGQEHFTILSQANLLSVESIDMYGLIATHTKKVTFDLSNLAFSVADHQQKSLMKYVLPWTSLFIVLGFNKACDRLHDWLKKQINYTFDVSLDQYSYESPLVRRGYMQIRLKHSLFQAYLAHLLEHDLSSLTAIIEGRLIAANLYQDFLANYGQIDNSKLYTVSHPISKIIRDTDGLKYIAPKSAHLIEKMGKLAFNVMR